VIAAEGEFQASRRLAEAADVISRHPAALQLRYLQTLVEIAAENNSTTLFPIPIDIFRGLTERVTSVKGGGFPEERAAEQAAVRPGPDPRADYGATALPGSDEPTLLERLGEQQALADAAKRALGLNPGERTDRELAGRKGEDRS
jgi:hypothetical protein